MSKPAVSVIIPTHNSGRFVRHAIESVLEQTFDDLEVIVIDDGSTDGTGQRVAKYGSRVRYVSQSRGGPSAARNHGARLARGEWLAFLDADDFWYPHRLAQQMALIDADPELDFVTGNYHLVNEAGRILGEAFAGNPMVGDGSTNPTDDPNRGREKAVTFGRDAAADFVRHRFGILTTCLVRRELFERLGGFPERFRLAEDLHLMFRLVVHARRFGAVRVPLAAYRRREDSVSHRSDEQRHRVTIAAYTELLRRWDLPGPVATAVREQMTALEHDLAYLLARQRRRLAASLVALWALCRRPSRKSLRMLVSVNLPARETDQAPEPPGLDPVELFQFGLLL